MNMNIRTIHHSSILYLLGAMVSLLVMLSASAQAAITSGSGIASTTSLYSNQTNNFTIRWNVVSSFDISSSTVAQVINLGGAPVTIKTGVITSQNITTPESFSISATQVQNWIADGVSEIVIRREFTDNNPTGSPIKNVDVRLSLVNLGSGGVTSATGIPSTTTLYGNRLNTFTIKWNVTTTSDVVSTTIAQAVNLSTPETLNTGSISDTNIATPESFSITGAQVQRWIDSGRSVVVIRRQFADSSGNPNPAKNADVQLTLVEGSSAGGVTSASGSPSTAVLYANRNNTFTIKWNVITTTDVLSTASAQAVNVGMPQTLTTGTITDNNIATPERFSISGAQVQSWIDSGRSVVVIRRQFTDSSSTSSSVVNADVRLTLLEGSTAGNLDGVTNATGIPSTTTLFANRDNTFTIKWNVATNTDILSSAVAQAVNLGTPLTLSTGTITDNTITTPESFSISGAQVQDWIDSGRRVIVIRRQFTDSSGSPSPAVNADVRLNLVESGLAASRSQSQFEIQRLQLTFPNQTSLIVVEPKDELFSYLDVNYSGQGVLEGYWQIADPASTSSLPLYRNLKFEQYTLSTLQRSRISSPRLPTTQPGKYLLRFCVIDRTSTRQADRSCPNSDKVVEVAYHVLAVQSSLIEAIDLNASHQPFSPTDRLSWSSVKGAVVYQLQIFQHMDSQSPVFVGGMLLPSAQIETTLSAHVADKLENHRRYIWRINALNSQGRVIGQSQQLMMIYQK